MNLLLDYAGRVLALALTPEGVGLSAIAFFFGMIVDYAIRH